MPPRLDVGNAISARSGFINPAVVFRMLPIILQPLSKACEADFAYACNGNARSIRFLFSAIMSSTFKELSGRGVHAD